MITIDLKDSKKYTALQRTNLFIYQFKKSLPIKSSSQIELLVPKYKLINSVEGITIQVNYTLSTKSNLKVNFNKKVLLQKTQNDSFELKLTDDEFETLKNKIVFDITVDNLPIEINSISVHYHMEVLLNKINEIVNQQVLASFRNLTNSKFRFPDSLSDGKFNKLNNAFTGNIYMSDDLCKICGAPTFGGSCSCVGKI